MRSRHGLATDARADVVVLGGGIAGLIGTIWYPSYDFLSERGVVIGSYVKEDGQIFRIINQSSGMCMGVDNASEAPGADIIQFDSDGATNQRWFFVDSEIGGLSIINKKSGKLRRRRRRQHSERCAAEAVRL